MITQIDGAREQADKCGIESLVSMEPPSHGVGPTGSRFP